MSRRAIIVTVAVAVVSATACLVAQDSPRHPPRHDRPGWRGRQGPQSRPSREPLTPEQEAEILKVLQEKRPLHYARVIKLRESNPSRYRHVLERIRTWHERFKNLPEGAQNAALAQQDAKIKVWRLARAIRQATDAGKKPELKIKLRQAVAEEFQAEQKVRRHRLARMEAKLKQLRANLIKESQKRDEIIQRRVDRILKGSYGPGGKRSRRHGPRHSDDRDRP